MLAPDVDMDAYPPYMYLKSVNNTPIEGLWPWLKKKMGLNVKYHVVRGATEGIFNNNLQLHRYVYT